MICGKDTNLLYLHFGALPLPIIPISNVKIAQFYQIVITFIFKLIPWLLDQVSEEEFRHYKTCGSLQQILSKTMPLINLQSHGGDFL